MTKFEILGMLEEWTNLEYVGSYFEMVLMCINRHPYFLDRIVEKEPKNCVDLWRIIKEGV